MKTLVKQLVFVACILFLSMPVLAACGTTKYTVTLDIGSEGNATVKIGETTVSSGSNHAKDSVLTITATPKNAETHKIKSVKAGTATLTPASGVYSHTLKGNVTIKVEFEVTEEIAGTVDYLLSALKTEYGAFFKPTAFTTDLAALEAALTALIVSDPDNFADRELNESQAAELYGKVADALEAFLEDKPGLVNAMMLQAFGCDRCDKYPCDCQTVTISFNAGGTVEVKIGEDMINSGTKQVKDSVLTITVTPDISYEIKSVKAGATELTTTTPGVYTHTLTANVTILIAFEKSICALFDCGECRECVGLHVEMMIPDFDFYYLHVFFNDFTADVEDIKEALYTFVTEHLIVKHGTIYYYLQGSEAMEAADALADILEGYLCNKGGFAQAMFDVYTICDGGGCEACLECYQPSIDGQVQQILVIIEQFDSFFEVDAFTASMDGIEKVLTALTINNYMLLSKVNHDASDVSAIVTLLSTALSDYLVDAVGFEEALYELFIISTLLGTYEVESMMIWHEEALHDYEEFCKQVLIDLYGMEEEEAAVEASIAVGVMKAELAFKLLPDGIAEKLDGTEGTYSIVGNTITITFDGDPVELELREGKLVLEEEDDDFGGAVIITLKKV